jgi:hypothetical protein
MMSGELGVEELCVEELCVEELCVMGYALWVMCYGLCVQTNHSLYVPEIG